MLTTGRSGSTTLAAALSHATNYTVGHETRNMLIEGRLDYPDSHIEVDNRLQWFAGPLADRFSDARYVHLIRPTTDVVSTYVNVWERGIHSYVRRLNPLRPRKLRGVVHQFRHDPFSFNRWLVIPFFAYGIIRDRSPYSPAERETVARLAVETMNANIAHFLRDKPHMRVSTETFKQDVAELWAWLALEGDLGGCLTELEARHNRDG